MQQGTTPGEDDFEDTEVVLMDFEDAIRIVRKNKIVSMGSSLVLLLLQEKLAENEITL